MNAKILTSICLLAFLISGCNLKINLNSNLNQGSVQVKPDEIQNTDQLAAEVNTNQAQPIVDEQSDFVIEKTDEGMIKQIINKKNNEVWIDDLLKLCEIEVMLYAQPKSDFIILAQFNPGSDKPVSSLYSLNLAEKTCSKMAVSEELSDFGARILSPDQTKLAVALEINEAKVLKLLDLIIDQAKTPVTLGEGETLNGGYGALSNHFDIKWLDDKKIQYTVYKNTYKDYDIDVPEELEKVIEVRIATIE